MSLFCPILAANQAMITPVLSTVTAKEVLAHLFDNVLELHSNNIAALKARGGLWNYKKLHATAINSLERLYKSEHISLATFQYFSDWKMYIQANPDTTYNNIMLMTDSSWELVDLPLL